MYSKSNDLSFDILTSENNSKHIKQKKNAKREKNKTKLENKTNMS